MANATAGGAEVPLGPLLSDKSAREALQPLINCCYAFLVLNTLFVIGRLVSRSVIRRLPFWWDDFWVLPAYLCNIGGCAIGLYMAHVEIANSNEDRVVTNSVELDHVLKSIFAILQIILPGYAFTRFSILALYLRIFSDKGVRIACWVVGALIFVQWIAFAIASILQCTPVDFYWTRAFDPIGGTCIDQDNFYRAFTIPNIIQDVVIVVLPIPTVWSLKATRLRKWGLTFVFCIGTIALVASCIRLWAYETHSAAYIAPSITNVLILWLIVEPGIYLIAACLPAMHHLFAAMVPQSFQEVMEQKLAAVRYPLSNNGRGPSPNDNRAGSHPLYGSFTKLSDGKSTSNAKSGRRKTSKGYEDFELETGRFPANGIMVTTEVIITQEERIADVLGF